MKSPYVNELKPDQVSTGTYLVLSKEIRQNKKGDTYLSLTLADRTGDLEARLWDNIPDLAPTFDRDDFVRVKGLLQIFHNRPQLTVHTMRRIEDREVDFTDFFPASRRDPQEMWTELRGFADAIAEPHLHSLVAALLDDPEIADRYRRAPAAKQIHHAFLSGLLEHVVSVCHMARLAAVHYAVDGDLLMTGAILHDIGKVYELSYDRGFSYSDDGQLLGHLMIGVRMVGDKLRAIPDFPPRLRSLVEHMILSHHGHLEFGSPKTPLFPEALLLHYLDDLDSKMECMRHLIENDRQCTGNFTSYSSSLDRVLLKKEKYLSESPIAAPPTAPVRSALTAPSPNSAAVSAPPSKSAFADKLLQALQPVEAKRES